MTQPLPEDIQPGDLLVWYIPQVPMKAFEVYLPIRDQDPAEVLQTARLLLDTITEFSIYEFENRVKPDYSDLGGVSRWEEYDGGYDWCDLDQEELGEVTA